MKKLTALLLALVMVLGLAVACDKEEEPTVTDPPAVNDPTDPAEEATDPVEEPNLDPIILGSIQDTSGGAASAGQPNEWGVKYAVDYINENGGINGRMIELHSRDCQNDTEVGVTNYRELVDQVGVHAIIGPPLSNPASAWVELATEDEIPIVGHFMDEVCTTDPVTGEAYPYMFLAEPSCSRQSYIIAKYAMEELGVKTVATLFNTSNSFATAHEIPFVDYVANNGGEVLAEETFTWTDTDYSAQALKIASLNPDAVFLSDYVNQMSTAYDNLRDAGYEGVILGANTMGSPFDTLVKNEIKDCYFIQNYNLAEGLIGELTQAHMDDTNTEYRKTNVGFGWDAVMVLANAMKLANDPTDGSEVRDLLETKTVDVEICGPEKITIDPDTHRPISNLGVYIATYDENGATDYLVYMASDYESK
ncbi:MAG TPA: ABC transporter substrate-binding protein [Fastidiosipila sp.]|nr:ABC transporter substrate-binding protein [Eubacteriales bacterium]HHU03702.1 ABC transporter substrate-binding protein [Fastidiosipila sp.]